MKHYLLTILVLSSSVFAKAQETTAYSRQNDSLVFSSSFDHRTKIVSFGLGFPNLYRTGYKEPAGYAHVKTTGFGPLYAKFEIAATDAIGIVPAFGYSSFHYSYYDAQRVIYYDDVNTINLSLSGNYHFHRLVRNPRVDLYAGAGICMNYLKFLYGNIPPYKEPESRVYFLPIARIGVRYYLDPIFGFYAEGGYDGLSILQIGISVKF